MREMGIYGRWRNWEARVALTVLQSDCAIKIREEDVLLSRFSLRFPNGPIVYDRAYLWVCLHGRKVCGSVFSAHLDD
jgi:hypothetical protein